MINKKCKGDKKLNPSNFPKNDDFPKPCKIKISYDETLQEITGRSEEEAIISEGMSFILFLGTIFSSYPAIELKYPPGTLGFTVNGQPPDDFDALENGDEISFTVASRFDRWEDYRHRY